jgi:hypothetical protein
MSTVLLRKRRVKHAGIAGDADIDIFAVGALNAPPLSPACGERNAAGCANRRLKGRTAVHEKLDLKHEATRNGGRYFADVEGGEAELTYALANGAMIIDHTFVPSASRGRDIAERLVERAVEGADALGVRIVPQCPYVNKLFHRRPELARPGPAGN